MSQTDRNFEKIEIVQVRFNTVSALQWHLATVLGLMEAEMAMPQIWMTYEEVSELLGCCASEARSHAMSHGWARKKSRDGLTRLKLPSTVCQLFLDRYVEAHLERLQASSLPVRRMQTMVAEIDLQRSAAA